MATWNSCSGTDSRLRLLQLEHIFSVHDELLFAAQMELRPAPIMMCEVSRLTRYRRCGAALLLIVVAAACETANATEGYIEAGVTGSQLNTTAFVEQVGFRWGNEFGKERSAGWRLAAGYRISQYFALEAGFADFGNKSVGEVRLGNSNSTATTLEKATIDIKGPYAAVVAAVPVGHWHPFAKIGVLRADTSVSDHFLFSRIFTGEENRSVMSASAKSTELLLGAGISYRVSGHYSIALELTRVPNVGDKDRTGEADLTAVSLSAQYNF